MGGGSADAAAALRLAAALAPVDAGILERVAAALGADVPSQLRPGVWLGTGAGEHLDPLPALPAHAVVIIPLPHALATPAVYREADRLGLPRAAEELASWRERLLSDPGMLRHTPPINDLQPAAVSLCPPVAAALTAAEEAGAEQALVCGSGPTVAGLFWGEQAGDLAEEAARRLRVRHPGAVAARPVGAAAGEPRPLDRPLRGPGGPPQ
jgi:4-diphosphocytidyl-2-C-methyl-D-erythritol kinase